MKYSITSSKLEIDTVIAISVDFYSVIKCRTFWASLKLKFVPATAFIPKIQNPVPKMSVEYGVLLPQFKSSAMIVAFVVISRVVLGNLFSTQRPTPMVPTLPRNTTSTAQYLPGKPSADAQSKSRADIFAKICAAQSQRLSREYLRS